MVHDASPDEIKKAISETKLLFIDCWAPWCGPCLALGPVLEELDEKYADNKDVGFIKINTQNHREFALNNGIRAIPCVLVFYNGSAASFDLKNPRTGKTDKTDRLIGLRPADHYEDVIKQLG